MARGELPLENLDDRTWQELVDQAKALIPHYTPEWTDLGPSDLGITLVELFAWLVEGMLYRLNRVPDRTYLALLNLLNITRKPPRPASTMLSFTVLSGDVPFTIPAQFKVGSMQTEQQQAITFETDEAVEVFAANLRGAAQSDPAGAQPRDVSPQLIRSPLTGLTLSLKPGNKTSIFLGFDAAIVAPFHLQIRIAAPVVPRAQSGNWVTLVWQYTKATAGPVSQWSPIASGVIDETDLLRRTGPIGLPKLEGWAAAKGVDVISGLPKEHPLSAQPWFWLRLDVTAENQAGAPPDRTVTIQLAHILVNSVSASHLVSVTDENPVNSVDDPAGPTLSTGQPWQQFKLKYAPVFPHPGSRQPFQYVQVRSDQQQQDGSIQTIKWEMVQEFPPGPKPCFRFDPIKGLLLFGNHPGTAGASGVGLIPAKSSQLTITYRAIAGGRVGNVPPETLNLAQSDLGVGRIITVTNPGPGFGGADEESVEETRRRAPDVFRARNRAVTADDCRVLALEASSLVKKAAALATPLNWKDWDGKGGIQRRPGQVNVIIIPDAAATDFQPQPSAELIDEVQAFLNDRRVITTALAVISPHYLPVRVTLTVKMFPGPRGDPAFLQDLRERLRARICEYLHPLFGGRDENGWEIGQSLFVSGLFAVVQPLIDDAGLVEELSVAPNKARSPAEQSLIRSDIKPGVGLRLLDYELVCSAPDVDHVITVTYLT